MARIKKHKVSKRLKYQNKKEGWWTKQKIWTIFLAGLMVFSVFGILLSSYGSVEQEIKYNDLTFNRVVQNNVQVWTTKINKTTYTFDYSPIDVENINFTSELNTKLKDMKSAYIVFNPNMKNVADFELARFELQRRLSEESGIYVGAGITENSTQYNQPIITCQNATETIPVINLVESNESKVDLDGNCINVQATKFSIIAMKDRIRYAVMSIIN